MSVTKIELHGPNGKASIERGHINHGPGNKLTVIEHGLDLPGKSALTHILVHFVFPEVLDLPATEIAFHANGSATIALTDSPPDVVNGQIRGG